MTPQRPSSARWSHVGPSLILFVGGAAAVVNGRAYRHIEDAVAILGLSLVVAWLLDRRPAHRQLAAGSVLLGIGGSLVVQRVAGLGGYRDPAIFIGIALAIAAVAKLAPGQLLRCALCLLGVAVTESVLTFAPQRINVPGVWGAFDDGWAFGIGLCGYAVLTLLWFVIGRQRRGRQ